jgi:hypothetical protein
MIGENVQIKCSHVFRERTRKSRDGFEGAAVNKAGHMIGLLRYSCTKSKVWPYRGTIVIYRKRKT